MTEWIGCLFCKRRTDFSGKCAAFPNGIPYGIFTGDVDHTVPVEGDHGLQFEMRDFPKPAVTQLAAPVVQMLVTSRCPNDGKLLKAAPHPADVELWCRRCKQSVLPVGVEMRVKARVDVPSYISANAKRGPRRRRRGTC
ncbi:MAG: hypothetical protein EXR66_01470 [Dehalococcoidia bacterium]|nr:hypothetical protein [Dehalococcoidia bacterium]